MKILLMVSALFLTGCGFEVVDTGYRGVQTRFGEVVGAPLPEGLHLYNPFTSSIKEISVRERVLSETTAAYTKDKQNTDITYALNWSPLPDKVGYLYQTYGTEEMVAQTVVLPAVRGALKVAIGQLDADTMISSREQVTNAAMKLITSELAEKYITATSLNFTDINFDDAYEQAVRAKVVAVQEAEKAKNETVKIREEANQAVISAKAEAEAMKIKSQALAQNKGLIEFEIAQKWDGRLPETVIGGASAIPMLNINGLKK